VNKGNDGVVVMEESVIAFGSTEEWPGGGCEEDGVGIGLFGWAMFGFVGAETHDSNIVMD
jgi:hypothetical protein